MTLTGNYLLVNLRFFRKGLVRAHIKPSIFGNILWRIENAVKKVSNFFVFP